jgi:cobalt/nickel transport system permease protein
MHISEGVLSAPVLLSGGALTAVGTAIGLKKLDYDQMAKVGILSSAFFMASLIHVNIGPSSVHLLLNGILGLMLGWAAFPAVLVGLLLQAMFFQFGGITVIGVNTFNVAGPAVFCYYLFNAIAHKKSSYVVPAAFFCGALSVMLTTQMVAVSLLFTEESFMEVAILVVTAHLPVMIIEAIVTGFCMVFLRKVQPEAVPALASLQQP